MSMQQDLHAPAYGHTRSFCGPVALQAVIQRPGHCCSSPEPRGAAVAQPEQRPAQEPSQRGQVQQQGDLGQLAVGSVQRIAAGPSRLCPCHLHKRSVLCDPVMCDPVPTPSLAKQSAWEGEPCEPPCHAMCRLSSLWCTAGGMVW